MNRRRVTIVVLLHYLAEYTLATCPIFQDQLTEWGALEPIDFIFDERSEKENVRKGFEVYRATVPDEITALTGREPIFEDDEKVLPLQAADMWAWWCRKTWLEEGKLKKDQFPMPWGSFEEIPALIVQWTEPDIEAEFSRVLRDLEAGNWEQFY